MYNDGTTCDCTCGAHDPDCDLDAPPITGCTANQVCGAQDTCVDKCDSFATPRVGCGANLTCGVENDTTDLCYDATDPRFDTGATVGTKCTVTTAVQCAITGGFANGFCDFFADDDETCRKACNDATDCTPVTQLCQAVTGTKGVCVNKAANDTCQTAKTITIGTPINDTSAGSTNNYNTGLETATCTGGAQPGLDVAYKVTLTAAQAITVTLSNVSADYDPSVAIAGLGTAAAVCDAATINCLGGADAGFAGDNETFQFIGDDRRHVLHHRRQLHGVGDR